MHFPEPALAVPPTVAERAALPARQTPAAPPAPPSGQIFAALHAGTAPLPVQEPTRPPDPDAGETPGDEPAEADAGPGPGAPPPIVPRPLPGIAAHPPSPAGAAAGTAGAVLPAAPDPASQAGRNRVSAAVALPAPMAADDAVASPVPVQEAAGAEGGRGIPSTTSAAHLPLAATPGTPGHRNPAGAPRETPPGFPGPSRAAPAMAPEQAAGQIHGHAERTMIRQAPGMIAHASSGGSATVHATARDSVLAAAGAPAQGSSVPAPAVAGTGADAPVPLGQEPAPQGTGRAGEGDGGAVPEAGRPGVERPYRPAGGEAPATGAASPTRDAPSPMRGMALSDSGASILPHTSSSPPDPANATTDASVPVQDTDLSSQMTAGADLRHGVLTAGRADHGPRIVRQAVTRFAAATGALPAMGEERRLEIRLDPPELGNLRMLLSMTDTGLALHVVADRDATLELLRRNMALLGEDFARLGFGTAAFSFSRGGGGDARSPGEDRRADLLRSLAGPPSAAPAPLPVAGLASNASGLDLRI